MSFSIMREKERQKDSFVINPDDSPNVQHIQEASDIAQTIKELNDDATNALGFSKIDMKSRLTEEEISAILTIDTLMDMEVYPEEIRSLTLKKTRLAISGDNGRGRRDVVDIAKGMQQQNSGSSFFDGIGKFFGGGQK